MDKKEYNFYHDENEGYLLVDTTNGDILMDIPISESEEITKKVRSDVKNYLKESNQTIIVQDCFNESRIKFENGVVVGGYSRYEGHDKEVLELWGFNKLISYYEKQLEKVISLYGNDWRKGDYIKCAKEDLEAVKNGREW